ncbi:MAG: Holliday junction resolvase RuvX [Myxococcales bacterium]|nr:Holliday junction resolvase RuvX [Myxococcales bacterium]MCB9668657.1 Holliday junction resolvase RuvX [Alphaproteobacteria bacterium]MCB9690896.1 Holliday junction resolvase RuvX [Alphaproteobacteria bacterium]
MELEKKGRIIALDVGTKTIGVALTDALGMLAHPLCTLTRKGVQQDVTKLEALFAEHGPVAVVVGLPYELDGTEERSARLARQIADAITARTSLPVHLVDERYSSVEAERRLIEAGVSRKKRKEIIDQAAAVVILETWLSMQRIAGGEG